MLKKQLFDALEAQLIENLRGKYACCWDTDNKSVTYGWFTLDEPADIVKVAEVVAGLGGRVMAITAMAVSNDGAAGVEIAYHFAVGVLNCTFIVALADNSLAIPSITPILKSADWHEREMRELYDIKVENHPNPRRLFLEENMQMPPKLMVPLSEAMNGNCTTQLWEQILKSGSREDEE